MRTQRPSISASRRAEALQSPARIDWLGERTTGPRRFSITVTQPDGATERYERLGGSSMDHTSEALERAGLGGVVRVLVVEPGAAA